jgi:hypothetical protein
VLAGEWEHPRGVSDLRGRMVEAARSAEQIHEREPSLLTTQLVAQVRSVAVDIMRAAESLAEEELEAPAWQLPTEELLATAPG